MVDCPTCHDSFETVEEMIGHRIEMRKRKNPKENK